MAAGPRPQGSAAVATMSSRRGNLLRPHSTPAPGTTRAIFDPLDRVRARERPVV